MDPAIRAFQLVGDTYQSSHVVQGLDLFEAERPFPVSFRPADLAR